LPLPHPDIRDAFISKRQRFPSKPALVFIQTAEMPCNAHTIFYRGCGHVFLARSQSLEQEFPISTKHPEDQNGSHTSPADYPCNEYLPYTINISSASCQECTSLPKGFAMQMLGADPNDIEAFDMFCKQWLEQVKWNVKMEEDLRDAALKNVKDSVKKGVEKTTEEKEKGVEKGSDKEEDLLDWEDTKSEEYEAVGKA
jgi:hypothetical protein